MFCEVLDTYLLGCWRYKEKHVKFILISCGCVCINIVVMGLVLGQSFLMVISSTGVLLHAKVTIYKLDADSRKLQGFRKLRALVL